MRNRMYGGVRGRKTKVGEKLLRFPPTRLLLGTNAEMTQSFELQGQLNPRIKKPVGHIALSFNPEDKPRLTDEFMAKIALDYMR